MIAAGSMDAELRPGPLFEDLLERAGSSRQGDECIGQFGHPGFAFMHGCDGMEFGETGVLNFPLHQRSRNEARTAEDTDAHVPLC